MRDVLLNWQIGPSSGWGLLGLNLFGLWANDTSVRARMGIPIDPAQLNGVDPLRSSRIFAAAHASNDWLKRLGEPSKSKVLDAIQVDALGNDFRPISERNSRLMVGRAIIESFSIEHARGRLEKYHLLLTASRWTAAKLQAATGRLAHIIHEGVDESLFCPGPRSGWLDPARFYVFSGGKVEFRKAQDLVILAFKRFAARHPDAVLVTAWHSPWVNFSQGFRGRLAVPLAVGPGGSLDIRRWVVENGVDPAQVIDVGHIPNVLLPGILREMHVSLQLSRAEACTNLPVMEAMACCVPVIAAINTGMLDLLNEENSIPLRHQSPVPAPNAFGTDGWGESDLDEIDAALEFAYQDRTAAAARGKRARQWLIENGRTWQQHASKLKQWLLENAP